MGLSEIGEISGYSNLVCKNNVFFHLVPYNEPGMVDSTYQGVTG